MCGYVHYVQLGKLLLLLGRTKRLLEKPTALNTLLKWMAEALVIRGEPDISQSTLTEDHPLEKSTIHESNLERRGKRWARGKTAKKLNQYLTASFLTATA